MKKRFLGFILSILMLAGTINPSILNAKTTINPQDFINSDFRRPGDDLDTSPTDDAGNPKIKSFDKTLAYTSEVKESAEKDATAVVSSSEEDNTEAAKSTEEVTTVDKKYWKDGKEYTQFSAVSRELNKCFKKKAKDFTINVSFDCNTIKKYRESTFKTSDSNKKEDNSDKEDTDSETDERTDAELVSSMVLESLFNWEEDKEDTDQEESLVSNLEASSGLTEDETKEKLADFDVTNLLEETKDDEILDGRFYTTLHYTPEYKGETSTKEKTLEKKAEVKTSEEKTSTKKSSETTTQTSKADTKTSAKKETKKVIKSKLKSKASTQNNTATQAIDNAPETDVTINFLTAQFISGAKKENKQWIWTPVNATSDHMFVFRINYSTSGVADVPAGNFKITVPKQILRDRDGNFADFFTMSLPQKDDEVDDTDKNSEYAWKTEGDNIVIYNCKEITAAQNGYFDIGYSTSKNTYDYRDMGESEPFFGTLEVDGKTATTDKIPVVINTQATINNTSKYYPDLYRTWQDNWGAKPDDAEDYLYLVWMIGTNVNKCTQNYNFTLEDNVSSKDGKVEVVGYRMAGQNSYSSNNTDKNSHREGIRYDYVLTRHLKSDFDPLETYKIENNIKATVDPIDQVDPDTEAVASREFKWMKPVFTIPTGRFDIWKYGNENWHRRFGYHWDYASYKLDEFQTGKSNSLNNLKYYVWATGYPAPWTLEKGKYTDDPTAYYKNPVTYTVSDDTLYLLDQDDTRLNNETFDEEKAKDLTPLSSEDYDFSYLTFSMSALDGDYNDEKKDFDKATHVANDKDILTFSIKVNGEWRTAGIVNLGTGSSTIEDEHIKTLSANKIEFKKGVKGWRVAATNAYYKTDFYIYPYVNLYRTDAVLDQVKDKDAVLLKNVTNLKVTYDKDFDGTNDDEIVNIDRVIGDRIRKIERDSSLEKRAVSSSNNVRKKYYDVGWRVEQSEVMTTGNGEKEYIRQNGGTFYDLLPKGSSLKKGSISVSTENGSLKESQYTYELIPDYKKSGRILLVIKIKPQAKYYNVFYHTQHPWDSIKDYGKDIKNPVAYKTGNDEITKGYPDNGGNLSDDNKELMSNLDKSSDASRFLYSEDSHWINALTAAISGLDKKVMTPNDDSWSYETSTVPEGTYMYRWRFANNFTSDAKDMIFFDSLENYVVGNKTKSDWHGTLQRIDTSQLEDKGIRPVIYISTKENLNLNENHDLTDKSVWEQADTYTDLSKAKAVAIDIRKNVDGTDYIMKSGESVNAILYMKAPATVQEELNRYPITYNNIYIEDTVIDSDGGEFNYFIHQDYTAVRYKITGSFSLDKVSSENASEPIEGIKFKLFGTSNYGTEINLIKETDKDGHIDFKDIEKGEYTLQEYGGFDDWLENHTEHKVIIHGDRTISIDGKSTNSITITNKPRIHTDISFLKKDLVKKNKNLEGAKFKLYGTSDYGNEISSYAVSSENGRVTFENIELGTYKLKELEAPDGYIRESEEYTVTVDSSANFSISNYKKTTTTREIKKYSHTPNIADNGIQNGNYANNLKLNEVVTIPGAKSLKVKIVYGGESASYDWVCAWEGEHKEYTAASNYSTSFTGKLGGGKYTNNSNTKEYTIDGDTITFAYKSDGSGYGDGYGYWAEVSGIADVVEEHGGNLTLDKQGNMLFYNEPLHDIRLVKKSSYDGNVISGATFTLNGTSNYGTKVALTSTSETNGFVDFKGLEAGSYVLQEVKAPDGFRLDDTKRSLTISKTGESNISGLNLNKYGNFDITNQKIPDGQITVIKKWKDKKSPEERTMPTIKISGEKPEITYNGEATIESSKWNTAKTELNLKDGITFQKDDKLYTVNSFLSKHKNTYRIDDETTNKSIYLYKDGENNFYWWSNAEKVYLAPSCAEMFRDCRNITCLDLSDFDASKVTNMGGMFSYCFYLVDLNVSTFDTSKVTTMNTMFSNCNKLTNLDVSNFNTRNVVGMNAMFYGCEKLTSLDVSNFNISNVTDISYIFSGCTSLTNLDVSNFDTSKVVNMSYLFYNCQNITNLNVSNFDTSNATKMHYMFACCEKLTSLDVSNFNTSKVTTMKCMFNSCFNLIALDVSNFDTSKVTDMSSMFSQCSSLTNLDVSNFDTSKVTDMIRIFYKCSNIVDLNVARFDTSKLVSLNEMFYNCNKLTRLDVSNFNTSNVKTMRSVFSGCTSLTSLDVTNFDTGNVTTMGYMFYDCSNLTYLNLTNFNTSGIINMHAMFEGCSNLKDIDIGNFDTSNVTDMGALFYGCSGLSKIDLSNFDTSDVRDMSYMFYGCKNLAIIYASEKWNINKLYYSSAMFQDCINLPNFKKEYVTDIYAHYKDGGYLTYKAAPSTQNLEIYNPFKPLRVDAAEGDETNIDEGTCGTCTWYITQDGELVIKPTSGDEGTLASFNGEATGVPWYSSTSKITSAHFEGTVYGGSNCNYMFRSCINLASLNLDNFNTSNITSMYEMFSGCRSLKTLNLSNFDTSKVTSMISMFEDCRGLINLDLSNFNTIKVTSMFSIFYNCGNLTNLNVSNFNTSNVINMSCMFYDCRNLSSLDVSNFDTGKVTNMNSMFYDCHNLSSLDISNFDTGKVTNMNSMFYDCRNLSSLDVSNFDTGKVTNMNSMFYDCRNLSSLDVSNFNTSSVTKMDSMFYNCCILTSLDVHNFDTSSVTTMNSTFNRCRNLTNLDVSNFDISEVTNINYMFSGCSSLTVLDVSSFNTIKVTNMTAMFNGCSNLTILDVKSFNTRNVTRLDSMFSQCNNLTELDLSNFNTKNVTDMSSMFDNCSNLIKLDVSNFDTSKVLNMSLMFNHCQKLTQLDLKNFNTSNVSDMRGMFAYCSNMTSINLSSFNVESVTDMSGIFTHCSKITKLNLETWNTKNLTTLNKSVSGCQCGIFQDCESLVELNIENFDTSKVTTMYSMFARCRNLTTLDISNFDTRNVTDMSYMFFYCDNLTSLNLSNFDTSKVVNMEKMFLYCENLSKLDISNFCTSNVKNMLYLFYGCKELISLDISNFDTSKVTNMSSMFSKCPHLSTLKLGKDFKSLQNTGLPTPSPTGTEDGQYTGKWTKGTPFNHVDAITASELMNAYTGDTMADTWYWEKNGQDPVEQSYTSISDRVYNPNDFTVTDDMTQEQKDALTAARNSLMTQYQTEDNEGNAGYWTHIDDNTDMYTFYVYDTNIDWNIWEEDIDGDYNTDHDIATPYILSAEEKDKTAVITNTIPDEEILDLGRISITKHVINWDDSDIQDTKDFIFHMSLANENNESISGSTVYGDTVFTNGKAIVTLKDDETITFTDIPAGYHYKVEEETPNGYTLTLHNAEGSILKDNEVKVEAVNRKEKPTETQQKYTSFALEKKLTGNYETKNGSYNFHLAMSSLSPSSSYKLSNGKTFTSDDNGIADIEVVLKPDEKVTIENIPIGTKYKITEDAGDYIASYHITDTNKLGKIQKSSDGNAEKNKTLSTSEETADEGENITVTYSNQIQDTQDLMLTKKVVNTKGSEVSDTSQYEIAIHFENMQPNSNFMSDLGIIQADEDGIVDLTTTIKARDVIKFYDVPVGVTYRFTETANDKTASYTIVDSKNLGKITSEKGANALPEKDLSTANEIVNKGENVTVTFINAKESLGSLKLIKKDGEKLLSGVTFSLTQEDGTKVGTGTTDKNGEILFENLEEDTYTVKEEQTTKGHTLLSKPFTVTIPFAIKKDKAEAAKMDTTPATLIGDTYYYYDLVYTVENSATPNLPTTGNKENTKFYILLILAIVAIVIAECYLSSTKKKKKIK